MNIFIDSPVRMDRAGSTRRASQEAHRPAYASPADWHRGDGRRPGDLDCALRGEPPYPGERYGGERDHSGHDFVDDFDLDEAPEREWVSHTREPFGVDACRELRFGPHERERVRCNAYRGASRDDSPGAVSRFDARGTGRLQSYGEEDYSIAGDAYREEIAYDKWRARRKKRGAILKVVAYLLLLPCAVAAVFLVSYALTCILNGASPDELGDQMLNLFQRIGALARYLLPSV